MSDDTVDITESKIMKIGFYFSCILCITSFIYMLIKIFENYSFKDFGSKLDISVWEFWNNFGLKRGDVMDFKINIRTFDASDDCNIRGKYKQDELTHLTIKGKGKGCTNIRNNNKL